MSNLFLYDYAIIRVVPKVEREEFINTGVMLSCPAKSFLEASLFLDVNRLMALDSTLDIVSLQKNLAAVPLICTGGKDAGPIGGLSQRQRFHWLSAPRSTIIQLSAIHSGLCQDPSTALEHLMRRMVRPLTAK